MADHFRAAGDMVLNWAFGHSEECNVEVSEWLPDNQDLADMVKLLRGVFDRQKGLAVSTPLKEAPTLPDLLRVTSPWPIKRDECIL